MRKSRLTRKTKETDIKIDLNLNGTGKYSIDSSIPFLDHMLALMCKHGLIDMKLNARGDIDIDFHHTVEDIGIVLGKAFKQALGDMKGISRYGQASIPMDELSPWSVLTYARDRTWSIKWTSPGGAS